MLTGIALKKLSLARSLALAVASTCAVLTTGCGLGVGGAAGTSIQAVGGAVHGGQSPIQNATVNLYVTKSTATGYGQAGTLIGTSLPTDVNGAFSIITPATPTNCPAGQQAYITASGGYPSGTPALLNTSTLMIAALGDCVNISSSTTVIINEVTTVAAAYALSGFMTTSSTAGVFTANVSAPSANSAATGTATAAAGLPHAFLNAATLASYSSGTANSVTPSFSVAGATVNGIVPAVEINTLGDILQSCVNGATGNASCVSLFGFTPSISGVAPTNTLQSMINLARNPYPSTAAMTSATGLFSLISGSPAFQPQLTAQPADWSLAVVYKGAPFFTSMYDIALDANDTIYAGAGASPNIIGLNAYGISTPAFTAGTAGSATRQIAADAHGNVWATNMGTQLLQYSAAAGGAPMQHTFTGDVLWGVAVDDASNVWVSSDSTATPNIVELAYTAGTPATYAQNYTSTSVGGFAPVELTIDAKQNIWVSEYYTNGSLAVVLPNLSAATAVTPTYTTSGTVITPVSATFASSALKPLGMVVDADGNAWYGITGSNTVLTTGIEEVIPTESSSVITGLTPQSLIANATLGAKASQIPGIDGAGTVYLPDNQGAGALGIHAYSTTAVTSSNTTSQVLSPPAGYLGCFLATATTTTCASGSTSAVYNPRQVVVDSTGSVWGDISTTGGFTQLIGLGAPSWPLLQSGKPGLSPGLTAVTSLP